MFTDSEGSEDEGKGPLPPPPKYNNNLELSSDDEDLLADMPRPAKRQRSQQDDVDDLEKAMDESLEQSQIAADLAMSANQQQQQQSGFAYATGTTDSHAKDWIQHSEHVSERVKQQLKKSKAELQRRRAEAAGTYSGSQQDHAELDALPDAKVDVDIYST